MKLSLIVPCYNEEESLPYFYKEVMKTLTTLGGDYELIFVDDGSSDKTLQTLEMFSEQNPSVKYLSFSRNFGKESAIYAGLCNAEGDYIAVMDADMQDPPSLLPEMLAELESGDFDSVATRRADRTGEPLIRSWFAQMFYRIINRISDAEVVDGARDYRLMSRAMVDSIVSMKEYTRFSKGIFGWVGFNTKWLEFENVERRKGETKWSFWGLFKYSLEGIMGFSTAPLAMASVLGLFFTFLAFVAIVFIIIRTLIFGDPTNGWPSMACIIIFMGGIQLFCVGILGQYLSKVYLEVKNRPIYIVKEKI